MYVNSTNSKELWQYSYKEMILDMTYLLTSGSCRPSLEKE